MQGDAGRRGWFHNLDGGYQTCRGQQDNSFACVSGSPGRDGTPAIGSYSIIAPRASSRSFYFPSSGLHDRSGPAEVLWPADAGEASGVESVADVVQRGRGHLSEYGGAVVPGGAGGAYRGLR